MGAYGETGSVRTRAEEWWDGGSTGEKSGESVTSPERRKCGRSRKSRVEFRVEEVFPSLRFLPYRSGVRGVWT